jgi:lipid A ethanolaminephosphotransferase
MAPDEQIHVGSMLWFDERFSKDININELKSIANKKLSHDNIFHTLLGLMNIKTTVYNEELDFIPYFK